MRLILIGLGAVLLLAATPAYAHGGGLNHCGCHINHSTGECHCHQNYGACDCSCRPASCLGRASCDAPQSEAAFVKVLAHDHQSVAVVQARGGGRGGSVHVKGHTTKSGTYVAPHYRSAPNKTKSDNYSTKGNTNPYTGKKGAKRS